MTIYLQKSKGKYKLKIRQIQSILVTGATGFINSRLVEVLLEKQYNVISLVRKEKESNINSKVIVGDIVDSHLKIVLDDVECVFHLASITPFEKNKKILQKTRMELEIYFLRLEIKQIFYLHFRSWSLW